VRVPEGLPTGIVTQTGFLAPLYQKSAQNGHIQSCRSFCRARMGHRLEHRPRGTLKKLCGRRNRDSKLLQPSYRSLGWLILGEGAKKKARERLVGHQNCKYTHMLIFQPWTPIFARLSYLPQSPFPKLNLSSSLPCVIPVFLKSTQNGHIRSCKSPSRSQMDHRLEHRPRGTPGGLNARRNRGEGPPAGPPPRSGSGFSKVAWHVCTPPRPTCGAYGRTNS
jgi:hypothetical protein